VVLLLGFSVALLGVGGMAGAVVATACANPPGVRVGAVDSARIAYADGLYGRCEELLRPLVESGSAGREARLLLGRVFLVRGRADAAHALFSSLSKEDPNDADALAGLAEACTSLGKHEFASAAWHRVVALKRDDPLAYRGLGMALRRSGDAMGALSALQRSLALDPAQSDLSFLMSEIAVPHDAWPRTRRPEISLEPVDHPLRPDVGAGHSSGAHGPLRPRPGGSRP
jgi:tetratricopeptide (TPR) repeat protein